MNKNDIFGRLFKDNRKRAITVRRDLHKIPEIGFKEIKTSSYIAAFLKKARIPFKKSIAGTGIIAQINGRGKGKTVLLRADIDAVPVSQEKTGVAYTSTHKGMMHACGHDAHTAMLLITGHILYQVRNSFSGRVLLVFQPAEEGGGGGEKVVKSGAIDFSQVTAACALHVWGRLLPGELGYIPGLAFAYADEFKVVIVGRGGHASAPHNTRDPISTAANMINTVNNIVSRKIPSTERAVVSFGAINGGSVFNVIPDEVTLLGTVRTLNSKLRNFIKRELERAVKHTALAAGLDWEFTYHKGYPRLINNRKVIHEGLHVAQGIFGPDNLKELEPVMGGEDFSYYLQNAPGAMFLLGSSVTKGITPHHNSMFNIDESVLIKGVEFLCRFSMRYVGSE